jgi:SPP1 gp7 family putative phage head morphogenesis protein
MSIEKDILKQFAIILNISEEELKKILKVYDSSQKQLEQIIFDLFKKYGSSNGEQFYNELKKYERLKKLDEQISNVTKEISTTEAAILTALLIQVVKDSYYRNIYILEKNLKININFNLLKPEVIETLVNMPIEGLQFSERLYANQLKLKQNVKAVIIDGVTKGQDIKTMSKNLNEKMNIGRYNATRICRTETARVWYEGQKTAWTDTGVKKVIYVATLDGRTSQICRSRDGKVYNLGEEPNLPAHPNCRSTYIPYLDDWKPSTRMDNQTKEFILYKTYEEWQKDRLK